MKFVAFDLETTGFLAGVDQITEVGAVRYNMGVPEAIFSTLVNPKRSIPQEASRITGITDEMVQGKPTIDAILPGFAEFCGDDLLVAHNAPFDFQFLSADIKKHETSAPKGLVFDTCTMARKVLPGLMNYKLGTLVQHLNIVSSGFHRAEEDASYCGQVFWSMIGKLSVQGQWPTLEQLIALSKDPPQRFPQVIRQPRQLDLLVELGL